MYWRVKKDATVFIVCNHFRHSEKQSDNLQILCSVCVLLRKDLLQRIPFIFLMYKTYPSTPLLYNYVCTLCVRNNVYVQNILFGYKINMVCIQ